MLDTRTPVVLVCGWGGATYPGTTYPGAAQPGGVPNATAPTPAAATAEGLLRQGTVLVHHDLRDLREGVVRRTLTTLVPTPVGPQRREHLRILELAHGCVSCTLREDLLPLLRRLHARSNVDRIVVLADPTLEPEELCWAVYHVPVTGVVGQIDGPAGRDVRVEAVLTCVDAATWLQDATGEDTLDERGVRAADTDERTVAQVAVGQVEFADALVVTGAAEDGWQQAKLHEVLVRLAPGAPIAWAADGAARDPADGTARSRVDAEALLRAIPATARRGVPTEAHSPLLRGQPPLHAECGVQLVEYTARRPFHPQRLHEAVDVLLDGVVSARGRLWVASQHDRMLWIESAGGGLRVADSDAWLAAMTPQEQDAQPPERRALAALRWDGRYGDRENSLVVLVHAADPADIARVFDGALLTDEEERLGEAVWRTWEDPFGTYHEDPCGPDAEPANLAATHHEENQ